MMEILPGYSIKVEEKEKQFLRKFFNENAKFIFNTCFLEYDNIRQLGDLYEKFLNDNNLRDNEVLMLFLLELRYDQIAYKLTDGSLRRQTKKNLYKIKFNDTLSKWYEQTKETIPVNWTFKDEMEFGKKLRKMREQRLAAEQAASDKLDRY